MISNNKTIKDRAENLNQEITFSNEKDIELTFNNKNHTGITNIIQDVHEEYVYLHAYYPTNDDMYEDNGFDKTKLYKIPKNRPVRIYCDGIYDLFHYGHARQLFQAKNLFPNVHLIIGICNDALTHSLKGITVMTDTERYETIKHCRYVDQVIENAVWVLDDEFIKLHSIDLVAHDDLPYGAAGTDDIYSGLKKKNKFVPTKRTKGISTSAIITRLISDYDIYLRKQILRGISNEDLNISVFKEKKVLLEDNIRKKRKELGSRISKELDDIKKNILEKKDNIKLKFSEIQNSISENQEKIKLNINEIKNELLLIIKWWEETSNEWLKKFVERFEPDNEKGWFSKLVGMIRKKKENLDFTQSN